MQDTTTYPDAHECRRGGPGHIWNVIPVEYVPNTWFTYVKIHNFLCFRCGKLKAKMWDSQRDSLLRYKHGTGLQLEVGEEPPDMLEILDRKVASLEDRRHRQAVKKAAVKKAAPSKPAAKPAAKSKAPAAKKKAAA